MNAEQRKQAEKILNRYGNWSTFGAGDPLVYTEETVLLAMDAYASLRLAEEKRMPTNAEILNEFEGAYGYLANVTKKQVWRHSLWVIELFRNRMERQVK
jgi:hypothetical protein